MDLRERLSASGISCVLFDLDDTLVKTEAIFGIQMRAYIVQVLSQLGGGDFDTMWSRLEEINNRAFVTYAVNPQRWDVVARELGKVFPEGQQCFVDELPTLMAIYQTVPDWHEGAQETLSAFRQTGVTMGLVTHANQEWTNLKITGLALSRFFDFIQVVNQDKHKGSDDWREAISRAGVNPNRAAVIGDSLRGDIRPAAEVGIRVKVWVPSKWVMYNSGEVPAGTIRVDGGIGQVVQALVNTLC